MGYDWLTVKSPSGVGRGFPTGKVPGTNFDKGMLRRSLVSFQQEGFVEFYCVKGEPFFKII